MSSSIRNAVSVRRSGSKRRQALAAWLSLAAATWLTPSAEAQDFERYRPRAVPPVSPPPFELGKPAAPVTGSDRVLLDSLDAVLILDDADKVDVHGADPEATGLLRDIEDPSSILYGPAFEQVVAPYLNQPVSLRSLNQLSHDIIQFFKRCKRPVVDVVIPEQKISGGTVQIVVVVARVGSVQIEDGCYFDGCETGRWIESTRRGRILTETAIEDDLFWLNQSPFRRVGIDLQPGQTDGTTDVRFTVDDVLPVRSYVGYDDTGVPTLGLERLYAGVMYGNLFGGDETLSYQYTSDADFNRLHAHAVTYSDPISRDYGFLAYGSWAGVGSDIGGGMNQSGESWQTGLALTRILQRNWFVDENLSLGFDFKSTDNNLEFGGFSVLNSDADLVELRVGYQRLWRDECDQYSRFEANAWVGPGGGFTSQHSRTAFNTIRPNTSPDYFYSRVEYERAYNIRESWQLTFQGTGQTASERLLFSETLGFGGYDSIRGYNQRTVSGDHGWITNFEFGPRPLHYTIRGRNAVLRAYTFVDAGQAFIEAPLPGENAEQTLVSAGVGMRFALDRQISFRADYGHGFQEVLGEDQNDRIHLGLIWQFGPLPN